MSFWAKSGMARVYGWYFLYCYDYWSIYSVLIDFVFPKHGSLLFLWVGEICYFDILSNCEQNLLATFYNNNWTKCSCTFIIIKITCIYILSCLFNSRMSWKYQCFFAKKQTLCLCVYICTKTSKQKYTKSLSLLYIELKYSFTLHFSKSESIPFHFALLY